MTNEKPPSAAAHSCCWGQSTEEVALPPSRQGLEGRSPHSCESSPDYMRLWRLHSCRNFSDVFMPNVVTLPFPTFHTMPVLTHSLFPGFSLEYGETGLSIPVDAPSLGPYPRCNCNQHRWMSSLGAPFVLTEVAWLYQEV